MQTRHLRAFPSRIGTTLKMRNGGDSRPGPWWVECSFECWPTRFAGTNGVRRLIRQARLHKRAISEKGVANDFKAKKRDRIHGRCFVHETISGIAVPATSDARSLSEKRF